VNESPQKARKAKKSGRAINNKAEISVENLGISTVMGIPGANSAA
jgi:hypothetical protein